MKNQKISIDGKEREKEDLNQTIKKKSVGVLNRHRKTKPRSLEEMAESYDLGGGLKNN